MRFTCRLVSAALLLGFFVPSVLSAQMMQGGMMSGGSHGMINLVSPADSPTQIRRGAITIGSHMTMMGSNSMGSGMPGPGGTDTRGLRLVLRLYGVQDSNGLVTSTGNHFIFEGQLATPTSRSPISFDQPFALNAGSALVQVPITFTKATGPATITIDQITVHDGDNVFAVPGVALAQPTAQVTPGPACARDSDCDDGNPNTRDVCMPMGCVHMPGGMMNGPK